MQVGRCGGAVLMTTPKPVSGVGLLTEPGLLAAQALFNVLEEGAKTNSRNIDDLKDALKNGLLELNDEETDQLRPIFAALGESEFAAKHLRNASQKPAAIGTVEGPQGSFS